MIVYQYFTARGAIKCIEERRLKISTIDSLNDPFEIRPEIIPAPDMSDTEAQQAYVAWREHQNATVGLLCFSKTTLSPLLWSHYADKHRGIAIGFEYSDGNAEIRRVNYPPDNARPKLDFSDPQYTSQGKAEELYLTKAIDWKYEEEYRELVTLSEAYTEGGTYFTRSLTWTRGALPQRVMTSVILGVRCSVSEAYMRHTLSSHSFPNVVVRQARLSKDKYLVDS